MRAALWLLALFGIAAAVALFASSNPGHDHPCSGRYTRVDLSLNLVLLVLVVLFVLLHLALRARAALFSLPRQARQWRLLQKERALHTALLDAMAQLLAGRFTQARKAAQAALAQERMLAALDARLPQAQQVRILAHLLARGRYQALQDRAARDAHLQQALNDGGRGAPPLPNETREGVQLRAARWALEDRDPAGALARLAELPRGAQRRTLALRCGSGCTAGAPCAGSPGNRPAAGQAGRASRRQGRRASCAGWLRITVASAHDTEQLRRAWSELEPTGQAP